jgi:hypothetical protein
LHRTESALPTANNANRAAIVRARDERGRGLINNTSGRNLKLASKSSTVTTGALWQKPRFGRAANFQQVLGVRDAISNVKWRQLDQN